MGMGAMASTHHLERRLYSDTPPAYQTRNEVNPTLLVSWWCTIFSLVIILIRVAGRWVRTERLFFEDKIMLFSLFPLFVRIGLVHVVLIFNTNNVITMGLSASQIRNCETGAKLVLASRIFYAAFIWVSKCAVLEFLKRTVGKSWAKSYEIGLRFIYGFLVITFCGVVIATLTECQPFDNYWQVVPDPGPRCREGLVQLIVMGACDMVTDVALVVFPVPIIMSSSLPLKKRLSMILLFLLSLVLIAITAYRIPSTISRQSSQQFRSLLASLEILASTCVANAVVIGSFIRDKGVKKSRFRQQSATSPAMLSRTTTRSRSVTLQHWGSDVDLALGLGSLPADLRHNTAIVPAVTIVPPGNEIESANSTDGVPCATTVSVANSRWNFNQASKVRRRRSSDSSDSSDDLDYKPRQYKSHQQDPEDDATAEMPTPGAMHFFDFGGLVDKPEETPAELNAATSNPDVVSRSASNLSPTYARSSSRAFLSDLGVRISRGRQSDEISTGQSPISERRSIERRSNESPRRSIRPSSLRLMARSPRQSLTRSPRPSRAERRPRDLSEVDSLRLDEEEGETPQGPDALNLSDAGGLLR